MQYQSIVNFYDKFPRFKFDVIARWTRLKRFVGSSVSIHLDRNACVVAARRPRQARCPRNSCKTLSDRSRVVFVRLDGKDSITFFDFNYSPSSKIISPGPSVFCFRRINTMINFSSERITAGCAKFTYTYIRKPARVSVNFSHPTQTSPFPARLPRTFVTDWPADGANKTERARKNEVRRPADDISRVRVVVAPAAGSGFPLRPGARRGSPHYGSTHTCS